jgi:hypothetical protein
MTPRDEEDGWVFEVTPGGGARNQVPQRIGVEAVTQRAVERSLGLPGRGAGYGTIAAG